MELEFKRDTVFRKQFFTPGSFAHPAKMDSHLLLWIVERYTQPGDIILDPMAGMGTMLLSCTLDRDVILVELEEKFCQMCRDNWEIVKTKPQLGHQIGNCQIIQGDARQLEGLLIDKCIFSPPYAAESFYYSKSYLKYRSQIGRDPTKPSQQTEGYGKNRSNIGNLPYGQIDKIVTSPPYAEAQSGGGIAKNGYQGPKHGPTDLIGKRSYMPENTGSAPNNIQMLPYGNLDSIITSPLYENQGQGQGKEYHPERMVGTETGLGRGYSESPAQIGNLKSESYLEAMLQVYKSCFAVLRDGGLMVLVVKNFIRNKQVIRLDEDTTKLCEQAGFRFLERHYRKLSNPSFWRIIYHQKYPDVEKIEHEDILVFQR